MKGDILLVVGSLNANVADRNIKREEVKTVQVLKDGQFEEIPFFTSLGELGVSSICYDDKSPHIWYYTTGNDLIRLDIENQASTEFKISQLKGVHEISFINEDIWLSNTYFDEIIQYSLKNKAVEKRIKLEQTSTIIKELDEEHVDAQNLKRQNKFHCNQIFMDYEGKFRALVHHVNGEQIINRVAQKLIKSQGNGGVLDIESGESKRLKLKAPHSVRLVNGQYWIFDSGHAQLNIYNKSWDLIKEVSMAGWGRGGDYSEDTQLFYAGVSAKRNRYLAFNEENRGQNMIQAIDLDGKIVDEIEVPNVEQINNVYKINAQQLDYLKQL